MLSWRSFRCTRASPWPAGSNRRITACCSPRLTTGAAGGTTPLSPPRPPTPSSPLTPLAVAVATAQLPPAPVPRWALVELGHESDPRRPFTAAAAPARHLRDDPVLPARLPPAGWRGARLRKAYRWHEAELGAIIPSAVGVLTAAANRGAGWVASAAGGRYA